jgi:glycosyltransferase involved in cell wall biosynthesis
MKILVLNWKDHHHPLAGGAEDYTYNVMKRLASKGHQIRWFTSAYPGAERTSSEVGIEFIREGTYRTVQGRSKHFLESLASSDAPDIIVDEVNTRPFNPSRASSPKVPIVNLIHQLAREVWFEEVPLPLAVVGRYFLEDYWLKKIRAHPTITVSKSTESDLRQIGFQNVDVVYNALPDGVEWKCGPKDEPPLLLYLGRLTKGKRPQDCLEAFRMIRGKRNCSMSVVGSGPLLERLRQMYPEVNFLGHVSESVKHDLLSRASILFATGTREGWNRGVLEAQAHGVVPIAQDVPGLRDAVTNGQSGIVVFPRNPKAIADSATALLRDPDRLFSLSRTSIQWATKFTYSVATSKFESILIREVGSGFGVAKPPSP